MCATAAGTYGDSIVPRMVLPGQPGCCSTPCHATLCRASIPVGDGGQQGTQPGADLGCGSVWAAAVCPSPGARCHTRQVVLALAGQRPGWCHGQAGERPLARPLGADVCSGSCVYP